MHYYFVVEGVGVGHYGLVVCVVGYMVLEVVLEGIY